MDAPESSSSSHPLPAKAAPKKKAKSVIPRCKPPCFCPLSKIPSSSDQEFEHILNSKREVRVPTFVEDVEKRPSKNDTGMGLFAKKAIPAGSVVLAERVMCVSIDEMKTVHDLKAFEGVLERSAKRMGPEWYAKFLELGEHMEASEKASDDPNKRAGNLGLIEGIWLNYHFKAIRHYKLAGILGLNLAWLNHSCVPNCTLTMVKRHHDDGFLRPEPIVTCVVLKATKDISSNEEICVSYCTASGTFIQRQLSSIAHFGFSCRCHWCSNPSVVVEETYEMQQDVDILIGCPRLIQDSPALIFQAVYELMGPLNLIQNQDARTAQIWAYCALIAGFHSDVARAVVFLDKALTSIRALRPIEDPFRREYTHYRHNLENMPGFGGSIKGASTENGIGLAQNTEVLFMTLAWPDEYLRVGQYRRLTSAMKAKIGPQGVEATFMVIPAEGFNARCKNFDWKAFPKKYLRSKNIIVETKQKAIAAEVMRVLTKDFRPTLDRPHVHTLDPDRPCQSCHERQDELDKLYAEMSKTNPRLMRGLPKHTVDALTGAIPASASLCEMGSEPATEPGTGEANTEATNKKKKKKKKKKNKGKGKGKKGQTET